METRFLQFINSENMTQAQFADRLGVARASISHILSGRNKPGYDFIEAMARNFPALNLEWLITGKGKMYKFTSDGRIAADPDLESPKEQPNNSATSNQNDDLLLFGYDSSSAQQSPAEPALAPVQAQTHAATQIQASTMQAPTQAQAQAQAQAQTPMYQAETAVPQSSIKRKIPVAQLAGAFTPGAASAAKRIKNVFILFDDGSYQLI